MEYDSTITKNEILPFEATWMYLEIIILSEVKDKISYDITCMWNLEKNNKNLFTSYKSIFIISNSKSTIKCSMKGKKN